MDKQNKMKAGLFFGIFMSIFFIIQSLWTYDELTTRNILISIFSGLLTGALSGVFFGWFFGWFLGKFARSKFIHAIKIDTDDDEPILFETVANHFKGIEAVGGKLYLTNKRLVFRSHKINFQNHELSIPLSGIENVGRYKTLGLVNNGLSVTTAGNKVEKFVVDQIEMWISQLTEKNGFQQLQT